MLAELLTPNKEKIISKDQKYYFYQLEFSNQTIHIKSPMPLNDEPVLRLLLGLKNYRLISNYVFHEPVIFNGFDLEKKDYLWLISKLSGLKNVENGKELDFIFTKLTSNFFSVLNLDQLLDTEQIRDLVHYMLSNRLFSYQMLYTLFHMLEKKIPISTLVSKRVYQTFLDEVEPFKESLENDKNWELLTVFISNYHFYDFFKNKNVFPVFFDFLDTIRKARIDTLFVNNELSKLIRRFIEPKEMISFFGQIQDQHLSGGFDSLEWENFKTLVSQRTYERIREDIWHHFDPQVSYRSKINILKKLIEFIVKKSPPFYFFNQCFQLKSSLNLIYDRVGPIYSAITLNENEVLQKNILSYLTPFRKIFVEKLLDGTIKKRGGISNLERQTGRQNLNYYLASAMILKDCWYLLD